MATRAVFYAATGLVIGLMILATVPVLIVTWSQHWNEKRKERNDR